MSSYNRQMAYQGNKKVGRYHHGNLRKALIAKAVDLLEQEGVSALSLRRIARDTGVSQAAPYSHFQSKKELLTAVCIEGTEWFGAYMSKAAAGRQGIDRIAGLANGYIHFALDHPALFHLMCTRTAAESADASGKVPEVFSEGYQMLEDALAAAPLLHLDEEQRQLDIPLAWGQVHGLTHLLLEGRIAPQTFGYEDLDQFIIAVVDRFLQNKT